MEKPRSLGINRQDIEKIVSETQKEDLIFAKKSVLDPLYFSGKIIGRQKQGRQLVRYLAGYKQGFVVPYISVYGRSGSGKSVLVQFVCENMDDISLCFANLRQAKTVFGAANLILAELGLPNLKSPQGINTIIDTIGSKVESILQKEGKKLFVLVLDELDTIFYDRRGKPSDFIYKLIVLEEDLRKKGLLMVTVGISNNVLSEYELDDRVKSRIGTSEVFFEPYSETDVLAILQKRAREAFAKKVDRKILEHCSYLASDEHGDARRAIDLLRVSAEIASSKGEMLSKEHLDLASEELQKDRVENVLQTASYHLKLTLCGLARITYLTGDVWHSTSTIYKQYCKTIAKEIKPLTYRRVSEILNEIENTGLAVSKTSSNGRYGYGKQYKLTILPEIIGAAYPSWWHKIVEKKQEYDNVLHWNKTMGRGSGSLVDKSLWYNSKLAWGRFVGR